MREDRAAHDGTGSRARGEARDPHADRERARVAVLRAVDASIDRYVVHSPAVHRSAELLAKRLGDREGAAEQFMVLDEAA